MRKKIRLPSHKWHDPRTPEVIEVDQYEVVPMRKKFWSFSIQPNKYSIMDGAKCIGEIGNDKVSISDSVFDARFATIVGYRTGPLFSHIVVKASGTKIPFFFCDQYPLCLPNKSVNFSFFSTLDGCKLEFGEGVFRILDSSGGLIGEFLSSNMCKCDHPKSNGCVRLKIDLAEEVRAQLLAALSVVGTAHAHGFFSSSGF